MKLKLFSLATAALLMAACSNNTSMYDERDGASYPNAYIEFNNFVSGMTRASKNGTNPFVEGDAMGVWGYQTTGEYLDTIFNNQRVYYVSGNTWNYDNKKLWNIGSKYKFYGMFPYSEDLYVIGDSNKVTIANYVNPNDPDKQVDLMISEIREISPFNTVDMIFHHIMSNVNILVKISNKVDTSAISGATLLNMHVGGVMNTGTYTQKKWDKNKVAVGEWTGQSGLMDIADVKNVNLNMDGTSVPALNDYIMVPQQLYKLDGAQQDVMIDATFRVRYKDGTSSTFVKNGIRLAGIQGMYNENGTDKSKKISSWDINSRYNYILAFNPAYSTRIWDADGDGSIQIDPATGDTITKTDDTPTPGTMQYDPENPDVIQVFEDTDGDGIPDTWVDYPIIWEDIDDDGLLEGGIDRDGDGHIDNVDNENDTQQGGDPHTDPTDGNSNNPDGKDVILVHVDTDGDGDVDEDDGWVQLEKDPDTGEIFPERESDECVIEFTATVSDWDKNYMLGYEINK